jgi:two-component system, LytTR family, sensor kinase
LGSNAKKVMDGTSSGVGVKNTDQRLRSSFGPGHGLRIRSDEWGYSTSFFIPITEEDLLQNEPASESSLEEVKSLAG